MVDLPLSDCRLAVIGCGGFIGSHLIEALLRRTGCRIRGIDRDLRKLRHLMPHPRLHARIADMSDAALLREEVEAVDVVVNLAAICTPADYNTRPVEVIEANYVQALPLVRLCSDQGRWLVQFSTCEVYGRTLAGYAPEGSAFRSDPANYVLSESRSPLIVGPVANQRWTYSVAKQLLERTIVAEAHSHGLRYTIVRPFNFIGARMDFMPGVDGEGVPRVVPCFMYALLTERPLQLVDGGRARRTFIDIEDAVDAVVRMLCRPARSQGRIFNVGHPANETSIAQLASDMVRIFARIRGCRAERFVVEDIPAAAFYGAGYEDCDRRVPDIELAREKLNWQPRRSLEQTLERTIEAYVQQYAGMVEDPTP